MKKKQNWIKDIVSWTDEENTLYLSVVFTWHLPQALKMARQHSQGKVVAGGPAVSLLPDYLTEYAEIRRETDMPVLQRHNPLATFTSRGCPNNCSFCAVPRTEGPFKELKDWDIKPVVCDNNLLAGSMAHFNNVIDRLKTLKARDRIDFNQGLDARIFEDYHAERFSELKNAKLRFSFDHADQEQAVVHAIETAVKHGFRGRDIHVYVLIGYEDNPEDAIYRMEVIRSLDALPYPQRFQPLYAMERNKYIDSKWTNRELHRIQTYYSNLHKVQTFFGKIPYADWHPHPEKDEFLVDKYGTTTGHKNLMIFEETEMNDCERRNRKE